MELQGKYGKAIIYTDDVEQEAISQVYSLLNEEIAQDANIRIMPDCHSGSGCVIGYTARITDKIVPNLIGVDIGCGMTAWRLGKQSVVGEKFDKLDKVIRANIPSGKEVRESTDDVILTELYKTLNIRGLNFVEWGKEVNRICKDMGQDIDRVWNSIGSLGGGNHFIEVDKDDNDELWLVIHSGSRNFGLKVALYHQEIAETQTLTMPEDKFKARIEEIKKTKKGKGIEVAIKKLRAQSKVRKHKRTGLEYLTGDKAEAYYNDMNIAQIYAQLSRRVMGYYILKKMYKMKFFTPIESVHNYINFDDNIVRKGSISAHDGEEVIIPLNMKEGCVIGIGIGNSDWNYSAPHGCGRKMSRSKAKQNISLEKYQRDMKDVWSSCIGKGTIDEAPSAYKDSDKVIEFMKDSVKVTNTLKSIYNFKASG